MAVGSAGLALAGCGSASPSGTSATAAAATPKRGGTLNLGTIADSLGSDTIDGQAAFGVSDWARSYALYNGLARIDAAGQVRLWLAELIEPNKDATEWTIRIPAGIKTHKGKPFGSKDILYSLRRIIAKQTFGSYALGPKIIDLAASRPLDERTLLVKYKTPFSQLRNALAMVWNVMVPEGFDPKDPDGTGPFVFKSFVPGQSSVFTRNPDYWEGGGKPYLDEFVVTDMQDETAQVNGLQSGQVNLINYLSAASIETLKSGGSKLYTANRTAGAFLFTMRMDQAPFSDNRVREAFRLMVDRDAMRHAVYGEFGSLGNDLFNPLDPYYDSAIPQRVHDVAQAKSLLKQAGRSGMSVQLTVCSGAAPGAVNACQLLATQATAAGVKVAVNQQQNTQFYAKSYEHVPFSVDFWMAIPYLVEAGMAVGPQAAFNTTHQDIPRWNSLWNEAIRTVDEAKQKELAHELQQIDHQQGANIIPMMFPGLDASSSKVHGIVPSGAATGSDALYWPGVWIED